MKKMLITGANSYIGTSFEKYMKQYEGYQIDTLDMMDANWRNYDFSNYDVVFHVAGIAHQKETKENSHLYYEINRDLAVDTARAAKQAKVKHFVFMSSMSVYGLNYSEELINEYTETKPKTNYGKSKLEAEHLLKKLIDEEFNISILRPPMVYGHNSPGNMSRLLNAVRKYHFFPTLRNQRSSITVEKLCEEIFHIIEKPKSGIFLPQNDEYMCTYQVVKDVMQENNIKVFYISFLNPFITIMIKHIDVISKVFGDLKYEK